MQTISSYMKKTLTRLCARTRTHTHPANKLTQQVAGYKHNTEQSGDFLYTNNADL